MTRNDIVYGVCGFFDGVPMAIAAGVDDVFRLPSLNCGRCDFVMIFALVLAPFCFVWERVRDVELWCGSYFI